MLVYGGGYGQYVLYVGGVVFVWWGVYGDKLEGIESNVFCRVGCKFKLIFFVILCYYGFQIWFKDWNYIVFQGFYFGQVYINIQYIMVCVCQVGFGDQVYIIGVEYSDF